MKRLILEAAFVVAIISGLIFLSIERHNVMDRAAYFEEAVREHKDNEERLANELAAAIQQKNDIEKELIAALNLDLLDHFNLDDFGFDV